MACGFSTMVRADSSVSSIESDYVDWVDDIPAYNKAMTVWMDDGGRGEQPTKKRKVTKEIPAFKAFPDGQAIATMDADTGADGNAGAHG